MEYKIYRVFLTVFKCDWYNFGLGVSLQEMKRHDFSIIWTTTKLKISPHFFVNISWQDILLDVQKWRTKQIDYLLTEGAEWYVREQYKKIDRYENSTAHIKISTDNAIVFASLSNTIRQRILSLIKSYFISFAFVFISHSLIAVDPSVSFTIIWAWHESPAKTQISLGIRPVWSESSLSAWRKLGSLVTHWAHTEEWSDWTDVQIDLSLRWAHMSFCRFCQKVAQTSFFA